MSRRILTFATVVVATLTVSAPAWAHVSVNPSEATQGGFTKLVFRVPNERDDSMTVKVEVAFPTDHPLASVSVKPKPGWTVTVDKTKLTTPIKSDDGDVTEAVSRITWQGGTIKAGEFDEFEVSVGPLPAVDSLEFKALQTYADGQVVRWIEDPTPGGAEPEHPAPVLTLTKATADGPSGGSSATATTVAAAAAARTTSDGDDDSAKGLAIVALVVGALGLAAGVGGLAAARRRT
jgi:uncharacterized protein YcnI